MIEINWIGEAFDTMFSLLGKYGRWMNARGKKICFLIWNVCIFYWFAIDLHRGLYSQGIFCLFSLAINTYGYFRWKKQGFE